MNGVVKLCKIFFGIISGTIGMILLGLFCRRICLGIVHYDEVFNIYVSYLTAAMKHRHLAENHFFFQTGDLFNLPYVWLFNAVTGGTDGIVLFLRFAYMGCNVLLSIVFFFAMRKQIGRTNSILFMLILIIYAPFSIYSLWYDTAMLLFLLMGELFFIISLCQDRKVQWPRYLSGICHACMVYAYPTMLLVVLTLIVLGSMICIRERNFKKICIFWQEYILGAATIFAFFLAYVFLTGWQNIYFFQDNVIGRGLGGRALGDLAAIKEDFPRMMIEGKGLLLTIQGNSALWMSKIAIVFDRIISIFSGMLTLQREALFITLVMLVQWLIGLRRRGVLIYLLIFEIIFVPYYKHMGIPFYATIAEYAYYFFWAPFLYICLPEKDKRTGKVLLGVLWGTSWIAALAIGFTALYDIKASMGFYPGAICTFVFMLMILRNGNFSRKIGTTVLILLIAIINLFMLYNNPYENNRLEDCNYRIKEGVFKGIYAEEKDLLYERMGEILEEAGVQEGMTAKVSEWHTSALIEKKLIYAGMNWNAVEDRLAEGELSEDIYSEEAWPDVFILDDEERDMHQKVISDIIQKEYNLAYEDKNFYLYLKK